MLVCGWIKNTKGQILQSKSKKKKKWTDNPGHKKWTTEPQKKPLRWETKHFITQVKEVQFQAITQPLNAVVDSAIFYTVVCWGSSIKVGDSNKLDQSEGLVLCKSSFCKGPGGGSNAPISRKSSNLDQNCKNIFIDVPLPAQRASPLLCCWSPPDTSVLLIRLQPAWAERRC